MNTLAMISVRPIERPRYTNLPVTLETFERWFICNHRALKSFWAQLEQLGGEPSTPADFQFWAQCQYDIAKIESLGSADTARESQQAQRQKDLPPAGLGSVEAGIPSKLSCRPRYYEAAGSILEDELGLHSHDNANELGGIIEAWLANKRGNWEPR